MVSSVIFSSKSSFHLWRRSDFIQRTRVYFLHSSGSKPCSEAFSQQHVSPKHLKGQHLVPQMYCLLSSSHTTNITASSQLREIDPLYLCFPGVFTCHNMFRFATLLFYCTVRVDTINSSYQKIWKVSNIAVIQQITCMFLCDNQMRAMSVFHLLLEFSSSIVILLFKKGKNGVRYLTYGLVNRPCKSH